MEPYDRERHDDGGYGFEPAERVTLQLLEDDAEGGRARTTLELAGVGLLLLAMWVVIVLAGQALWDAATYVWSSTSW